MEDDGRARREEAERKALELIELTAAEARRLIDESAERALALLADAVNKAKGMVEAERKRGGDTHEMEQHVQEAQDDLEAALTKQAKHAGTPPDDNDDQ